MRKATLKLAAVRRVTVAGFGGRRKTAVIRLKAIPALVATALQL